MVELQKGKIKDPITDSNTEPSLMLKSMSGKQALPTDCKKHKEAAWSKSASSFLFGKHGEGGFQCFLQTDSEEAKPMQDAGHQVVKMAISNAQDVSDDLSVAEARLLLCDGAVL